MNTQRRITQKPSKATAQQQSFLLVHEPADGEELRIVPIRCHPDYLKSLQRADPRIRLFVEGQDNRGPEAPYLNTYIHQEGMWHPETSGHYMLVVDCPEVLNGRKLHFGTISAPQPTKAALHQIYLDILKQWPDLEGHLRAVKRPCLYSGPSAKNPSAFEVAVDLSTLPPPCGPEKISRFLTNY